MTAPPRRRVWNWAWRWKKLRRNLARGAAGFAFFLLLLAISIVALLARFGSFLRRALLGVGPKGRGHRHRTNVPQPIRRTSGRPDRQVMMLDNGPVIGSPTDPLRSIMALGQSDPPDCAEPAPEDREALKEAALSAVQANLELCRTPMAAIAVAENAHNREELHWDGLEAVFARLVQLDTDANALRELMEVCSFQWVYEMPASNRIIRLIENPETGAMRWRHKAAHMIEFEFSGTRQQAGILPDRQMHQSTTNVQTFYNQHGRFIHWQRALTPHRRSF
ncbi:MAG: hypothetical protein K0U74_07675 [Alphaproteobacteria bacterium]|nr:hypothetical protein [Alphaproteobacteria bacterium]